MTLSRAGSWYHAVAPVSATVECGGDNHLVRWQRGKLALVDHDLEAERTMLVFGGEPCTCMRVLEMWRNQFGLPPEAFAQMDRWLGDNAYLAPPEFAPVRELAMVLGWERAWRKSAFLHKKQARLLNDELRARALRPLREHLNYYRREVGARMVSSVEVAVVPSNQSPTVEGAVEGISLRALAKLPGRWAVDVAGRGVALIDGAFVLAVRQARSVDDLEVTAVRWLGQGSRARPAPGLARATRSSDGAWSLEWVGTSGPSGPLSGGTSGPSGPLSGGTSGPSGPLSGGTSGPSGPLSGGTSAGVGTGPGPV